MSKSKKAFIATIYNEEKSIKSFLNSLRNQSELPDEIVIVDGGSTDKTLQIAETVLSKFPKTIKKQLLSKKGNRSKGRNYAVSRTNYSIIAVSDAGCILDKFWFERITSPFKDRKIDVVSGFYRPKTKTMFQKALATYTCVMEEKLTSDFNPSSRSIAFRKDAWKNVNGYPEELDTCEDMVFVKRLRQKDCNFYFQKSAIVFWKQKKNIFQAFMQFYSYAVGDGQALYIRFQTYFLYARYFILVLLFFLLRRNHFFLPLLFILFVIYCFWAIVKNYRFVKNWKAIYLLPLLQFTADFAVFIGTAKGLFDRSIKLFDSSSYK